ncbi:hypothetical protein [Burkholderia sp. BCC1644]|uniref:hypothetical protein n=1 Tax=Burkholderia sp. BCC1644 TaxID=2676293 RepID=UPI001FC8AFC9|nr:hypothetical protein [Burkholderia sp. BCC1644]
MFDGNAARMPLIPWFVRHVAIARNWSSGEPVAVLRDDGVPVWLYADGRASTSRR